MGKDIKSNPQQPFKEQVDGLYQQFIEDQASKYFCHKIFLRLFLEENSEGKEGDFKLHFKGKNITIEPAEPNGKTFKFRL